MDGRKKESTPMRYAKIDNYDAINVDKVEDIPCDYFGVMGVPITFLDKYDPEQFELVGITKEWSGLTTKRYPPQVHVQPNGETKKVNNLNGGPAIRLDKPPEGKPYYVVDGKIYIALYTRLLIRRVVQPMWLRSKENPDLYAVAFVPARDADRLTDGNVNDWCVTSQEDAKSGSRVVISVPDGIKEVTYENEGS